ncbi:unnamed protein product, partial [Meganyctiphanes norvegica]
GQDRICYKKVAVVEDFFDIIYNLHVCKDGKDKKHMGQKRTYRAVSERYAFVPREAVTKFLVLCTECPRRSSATQLGLHSVPLNVSKSMTGSHEIRAQASPKKEVEGLKLAFPVPISASQPQTLDLAYQQQQLGLSQTSTSSIPTSQPPLFTYINSHIPSATYLPQSKSPSMVTNLATPTSISITKPPHILAPSSTPSGSLTKYGLVSQNGTTPTYVTSSNQDQITSHPNRGLPFYAQRPFLSFAPHQNPITTFAPLPIHPITGFPLLTHLPQPSQTNSVIQPTPFLQPPLSTQAVLSSLPPSLTQPSIFTLASTLTHPTKTTQSPVTTIHKQKTNSSSPLTLCHGSGEDQDMGSLSPKRMKKEDCNLTPPYSPEYDPVGDDDLDSDMLPSQGIKAEAFHPTPPYSPVYEPVDEEEKRQVEKKVSDLSSEANYSLPFTSIYLKCTKKLQENSNNKPHFITNNINKKELTSVEEVVAVGPLTGPCPVSPVNSERGTTGTPLSTTINTEDTSSNGINEDEEDDADDNEDVKTDVHFNPDRLKAFNIFVRLFVDENLDRIVPINKQPKEKIQAIIDACARQFPEFAERTRKRILSYLKSCRRNKRTRDSNGWDTPPRLTPPHLTSIQAEKVLASACENEAQNAKRMRLGHEPIAQANPLESQLQLKQVSSDTPIVEDNSMDYSSMFQDSSQQSSLTCSTLHSLPVITPLLQTTPAGAVSNGPTDLSVQAAAAKVTQPSLNALEVAAVRQLITGYRETAENLLQSADKLENLLNHQQAS